MAFQPCDVACTYGDPLLPPLVLNESVSPSSDALCIGPTLYRQLPLQHLICAIHAIGIHLVVLAQYLEYDHYIGHLNPIKNIFKFIFIFEK